MTFAAFESSMERLQALKFRPASLETHWIGLSDLAEEELSAAIERAARECEEFPTPRMLRAFVDERRRAAAVWKDDGSRSKELVEPHVFTLHTGAKVPIKRTWSYYCEDCSDTGMRSWWCGKAQNTRYPWLDSKQCGRTVEQYEHEWVEPCPCAATNPDVLRKKAHAASVGRRQDH